MRFFGGFGRTITDEDGYYWFKTIKPGPYPYRNRVNDWRPAHIHFSLLGPSFLTRLVTQMYFPGDPLLAFDPIYNSVPENARPRLQAVVDANRPVNKPRTDQAVAIGILIF